MKQGEREPAVAAEPIAAAGTGGLSTGAVPPGGQRPGRFTRQEKSWIMYDWANSVYATIMMAAVYPIFFTSMVNSQLGVGAGDYWWSIGTSVAMVLVAVCAPIIGAFADYRGYKKRLFVFFLALGLVFTLVAAFAEMWALMLVGYIVSHIGFSGSCLVYDSFLTDVTSPEKMDKVSSYGYALGYIGGSTIPFLVSIALVSTVGESNMSLAIRLSLVLTVLWWGLFSIPFLKNIKQVHWVEKPEKGVVGATFKAIGRTAKKIFQNKAIFFFIIAYFFYIDGVGTVINMSTSYGTTLGLDATGMILALLVTQLVAFPCSILFSRLSKKFGSLQMLTVAVLLYLVICLVGFFMGYNVENAQILAADQHGYTEALHEAVRSGEAVSLTTGQQAGQAIVEGAIAQSQILFWVLAFMVGMVQGGIQAISRSHFGKLVPPENSGEFFGFFDIFGKFASVMGPLLYALINRITGRSSFAILSIVVLFLAALAIMVAGRKTMRVKE